MSCSWRISSSPRPCTCWSRSTKWDVPASLNSCERSSRSTPCAWSTKSFSLRALEVYEIDRLDFAEAYLVASAERSGVDAVASFDRSIDRVTTIRRIEPGP